MGHSVRPSRIHTQSCTCGSSRWSVRILVRAGVGMSCHLPAAHCRNSASTNCTVHTRGAVP